MLVVAVSILGSFVSLSMQCSGDALPDRLKLLLHSQKSAIDKRAELATLLKELTRCTSDSVIAEMTNSVVQVKDDTQLHVEFFERNVCQSGCSQADHIWQERSAQCIHTSS